jgi:hypothetical protein
MPWGAIGLAVGLGILGFLACVGVGLMVVFALRWRNG